MCMYVCVYMYAYILYSYVWPKNTNIMSTFPLCAIKTWNGTPLCKNEAVPKNDNLTGAIALVLGRNGPFDNVVGYLYIRQYL